MLVSSNTTFSSPRDPQQGIQLETETAEIDKACMMNCKVGQAVGSTYSSHLFNSQSADRCTEAALEDRGNLLMMS